MRAIERSYVLVFRLACALLYLLCLYFDTRYPGLCTSTYPIPTLFDLLITPVQCDVALRGGEKGEGEDKSR